MVFEMDSLALRAKSQEGCAHVDDSLSPSLHVSPSLSLPHFSSQTHTHTHTHTKQDTQPHTHMHTHAATHTASQIATQTATHTATHTATRTATHTATHTATRNSPCIALHLNFFQLCHKFHSHSNFNVLKLQCTVYCMALGNTHCITHCNAHCNTHCNMHLNTHCNTHCNTP